jgi:hypothetical protein
MRRRRWEDLCCPPPVSTVRCQVVTASLIRYDGEILSDATFDNIGENGNMPEGRMNNSIDK